MFPLLLDFGQLDLCCLEELLSLHQFLTKPVVLLAKPLDLCFQLMAFPFKGAEIAGQH